MINQLLIDALKTNLDTIAEINTTFEWLSRPLDSGEYPALSLRDPSDKVIDSSSGTIEEHKLLIEIDVVTNPDTYEAREIRDLVPKVKKMVKDTLTNDDFYYLARYLGRVLIGEHKDYFYVASRLSFEITYETEKWSEE